MAEQVKRFKLQRRLGTELPGLGKPGALDRRPYAPGQHGNKRRKISEYGKRLNEKQKLRINYQMSESQLRGFVKKAKKRADTNWVATLAGMLESRLDSVVFRLGFASSVRAARQLVSHGHVYRNGGRINIGSAQVNPGDEITLSEKAYNTPQYIELKEVPRLQLAGHLERTSKENKDVGILREAPGLEAIPFPFEPQLIAEHYSNIK